MSNNSVPLLFKDLRLHLISLFLLGLALFLLTHLGFDYLLQVVPAATYPKLNEFLNVTCKPFKYFSYLLMIGAGFLFMFKGIIKFTWNNSLKILFESFIKSTDDHMADISEQVKGIKKEIDEYIKKRKGPLSIYECKSKEDYKQYIEHACKELYGYHIEHRRSLYYFLFERMIESFCCLPHRDKVSKTIIVRTKKDNEDYVEWSESTRFNIHHVLFKTQPRQGERFPLEYMASSYAPDLSEKDWANAMSLKISVDGKKIITKNHKPKFERNEKGDGYFCWKEKDGWIYLSYKEKLKLTKEYTEVVIRENSINSISDTSYSLNTLRPTYGHSLDITIPRDFEFKEPYIGYRLAFKGLPDFIKKELNLDDFLTVEQNENHISIDIKDWILPGIILSLNWAKKPEKKPC